MKSKNGKRKDKKRRRKRNGFLISSKLKLFFFKVEVFWGVTPCITVIRGGSTVLQNVGILTQHYKASQSRSPRPEDGSSMNLRNVGILPQHYKASQPEDLDLKHHRRESLKTRTKRRCFVIYASKYQEQWATAYTTLQQAPSALLNAFLTTTDLG
jgi:hypothetical protein